MENEDLVPQQPEETGKKKARKARKSPNQELVGMVGELLGRIKDLGQQIDDQRVKIEELQTVSSSTLKSGRGKPRPGVFYVINSCPTENFPPQALKCMAFLWEAAKTRQDHKLTEAEAMSCVRGHQTEISQRQDAWVRVFGYYRERLRKAGHLREIGTSVK